MERFFLERHFFSFYERMRTLRRNSALTPIQKRNQFQRILDDYSAEVTARTAASPITETPSSAEKGPVDLLSEGSTDVESASGIQRTPGAVWAAGSVSELATAYDGAGSIDGPEFGNGPEFSGWNERHS
jgi:hypothetical protein